MMRGLLVKRGKLNPGSKLNKPYIENLMAKKFAAQPHEMKQEDQIERMIPRDSIKKKTVSKFIQSKLAPDNVLLQQSLEYCRRVNPGERLIDRSEKVQAEYARRRYERDAWSMYSVLFKVEQEEAEIDREFVMSFVRWLKGLGEEADHQKTPWYKTPIRHPAVDEFLGAWAKEKAEYLRQLDLTKNMPCKFYRSVERRCRTFDTRATCTRPSIGNRWPRYNNNISSVLPV